MTPCCYLGFDCEATELICPKTHNFCATYLKPLPIYKHHTHTHI